MRRIILLILVVAIIASVTTFLLVSNQNYKEKVNAGLVDFETEEPTIENQEDFSFSSEEENLNFVDNNNDDVKHPLSDLDLTYLKFENNKKNVIYSPLSIKYAMKMLEIATDGASREQISKVFGDGSFKRYTSSSNLSLANALFVKESFKENIKSSYIDYLNSNYSADVIFDKFESAEVINSWIKEKTFDIIPYIMDDDTASQIDFVLANAVAIDMEWVEKFIGTGVEGPKVYYPHEKAINVHDYNNILKKDFNNQNKEFSTMGFEATINNYNIVEELGEENIKQIVTEDYKKFLGLIPGEAKGAGDFTLGGIEVYDEALKNYTEEMAENELADFLPEYIKELKENYHKNGSSIDFGLYVDDKIKVFQKDLQEYHGTTLEYIGIMPITQSLESYINNIDETTLNELFSKIKHIVSEDFEEGVVTLIRGTVPKFKFSYDLDFINDLKKQGIKDVFDENKANLQNLTTSNGAYINDAKHTATIEFTQEGIKAAAATILGGAGAGAGYDYIFDVPVKKIDLTFDKPYMFIIRDKSSEDVWFVGTVYEPLLADEDETFTKYD